MPEETKNRYHLILVVLALILLALALLSLCVGPTGFSWGNKGILRFRFSRVLLSIIAGSSLAASGATLQALFKNPLADPHLFGISGGASLGACLTIVFCSGFILPSMGAIIGGFLAFLVLFLYARNNTLQSCLLIGILINAVSSSLITLLKLALPAHKSQSLLFWLLGYVGTVASRDFLLIIPLWLFGIISLWTIKGQLEILSFGFDEGRLLGLDPIKISRIAIVANCILVGNTVAWCGMIGFLGLLTPHLVRLFSTNLRSVLPFSCFLGAIILLTFDSLSRLSFWFFESEIPVGALCALFLSPIFFFLLLKSDNHVP